MKKVLSVLAIVFLTCGFSMASEKSKVVKSEQEGKTGIGFNSQLSSLGLTSIAIRHWTPNNFGFEGILGFSLGDNKIFDLGAKFMGSINRTYNYNFYGFGLLGIENYDIESLDSDTDFTLCGGLGIEFFLSNLPNIGFGFEIGAGYNSGSEQFTTFGHWIPQVGIRYYF